MMSKILSQQEVDALLKGLPPRRPEATGAGEISADLVLPGAAVTSKTTGENQAAPSSKVKPMAVRVNIVGKTEAFIPGKNAAIQFLRQQGVREEQAIRLCRHVISMDDVSPLISSDGTVRQANPVKKAVMIIGHAGAGHTRTIAKLAGWTVNAGLKCGVISLDTSRIVILEQVRIYSRILRIPFAIAANHRQLRTSLIAFSRSRDIIFIDMAGRNRIGEPYITEIERAAAEFPMELYLHMSAHDGIEKKHRD